MSPSLALNAHVRDDDVSLLAAEVERVTEQNDQVFHDSEISFFVFNFFLF